MRSDADATAPRTRSRPTRRNNPPPVLPSVHPSASNSGTCRHKVSTNVRSLPSRDTVGEGVKNARKRARIGNTIHYKLRSHQTYASNRPREALYFPCIAESTSQWVPLHCRIHVTMGSLSPRSRTQSPAVTGRRHAATTVIHAPTSIPNSSRTLILLSLKPVTCLLEPQTRDCSSD